MILLLSCAIKVSVIIGAALVATALMRRASAALRHCVLSAAIVCSATMPLLELVVPSWQVDVRIPSSDAALQRPAGVPDPGLSGRTGPTSPVRNGHIAKTDAVDAAWLVAAIWVLGVGISLVLMLVGFARLHWVAARATRVQTGRVAALTDQISREWGLRSVTLLHSLDSVLLVTWGVVRPKVLLPAAASGWSEERLRIVLRHELAHVARKDWAVQIVAELVRAFYWFNPLVWMTCRRLRQESEHASDDVVLARGVDASEYAEHLLELARMVTGHRRSWSAAPAMARPSSLERRITAMLNTRMNREPLSRSSRLGIASATVALAALLASIAFAQAPAATFAASVVDPSGAPLSETTIVLTSRQSGTSHAAPTDQAGYVEFGSLPPGEYTLEARAAGFGTIRDTVTLTPGERVRRDMHLNIGTVQETITVSGVGVSSPISTPKSPNIDAIREPFRGKRLQPPLKLRDVRPLYPTALWESGVEGHVLFEGRLGTDGTINTLRVVGPANADLASAAREAISQWRFEPTRLWGTPVETAITIDVDFKAQK